LTRTLAGVLIERRWTVAVFFGESDCGFARSCAQDAPAPLPPRL